MDIGLTAKVEPEVDERAADKEAGRLREMMNNAVSGLEASSDMGDVMSRISEMKERAQEVQVEPDEPPSVQPDLTQSIPDTLGVSDELVSPTSTPDIPPRETQTLDTPEVPSPDLSGQTRLNDFTPPEQRSDTKDRLEKAKPLVQTAAQTKTISGALSQLGNIFMEKGGVMLLGGLGLVLLSRLVSAAADASPLLGSVIDMFSMAMKLFFRPFGNIIGQALMPIAAAMLELAYQFNTIFSNQGFFAAFAWLGSYLVQNLAEGTLSFLGGSDNEFGIADAISTAFRGVALFAFIKTLLKGSLIKALSGIGGKGLLSAIRSAIPNLGISAFLSRLLPSIGMKQILKRIGLGGLVRILSSRFVYLIPVVGQIIGAIDLLTMVITALIPGMEMFSPLTYILTKSFELLVGAVTGTMSALGDFWGWLKSLAPDINLSEMFKGMLPSISVHGLISGMFAFVNSPGMSASTLLGHLFSFAQLGIDKIFGTLPDLSGGIGGIGMIRGVLDTVVGVLSRGFSFVQSLLVSIADILSFVSVSELPQLVSFVTALVGLVLAFVEWAFDTLGSFVSKVVGWIEGAGDIFSGGVDFVDDILDGTVDFVDDILGGAVSLGENLVDDSVDVATDTASSAASAGGGLLSGSIDFVQDVFGGTVDIVGDLFNGTVNIVQDLFGGTVNIVQDVFNGTVSIVQDVFQGTVSIVEDVFGGMFDVGSQLFSGGVNIAQDFFEGGVNIASDFFEGGVDIAQDMFTGVVNIVDQLFTGTVNVVEDIFGGAYVTTRLFIMDLFGGAYNRVSQFVKSLFGGVFSSVSGFIDKLFGGVVDIVSQVFNGGFSSLSAFVRNLFGSTFDSATDFIGSVIPDTPKPQDIIEYVFPSNISGGGFIDWAKGKFGGGEEGGVVTSPTTALIGEGGEPEYVVPESKLSGFVSNVIDGESGDSAVPGPTAFAEGGVVDSPTRALIGEDGETEYVVPQSKLRAFTANVLSGETGNNLFSDSTRSVVGDTVSSPIRGDMISSSTAGDEISSPTTGDTIKSVIRRNIISSPTVFDGENTDSSATEFTDESIVSSVREFIQNTVSSLTEFVGGDVVNKMLSRVVSESDEREYVMSESNLTEFVSSVIPSGSRSGLESGSSVTSMFDPQISPSVSVSSALPSVGVEPPSVGLSADMMSRDSVTAFAEGGVVTGPTQAMIGEDGESEAVVPFSKVDTFVQSAMAETSLDFGPQSQPSPSVDPSVSVDVESDIDADEIASAIGRELSSDFDELSREIQTVANEVSNMDIGSITITADGKVLAEVSEDGEDKYRRNRQVTR